MDEAPDGLLNTGVVAGVSAHFCKFLPRTIIVAAKT